MVEEAQRELHSLALTDKSDEEKDNRIWNEEFIRLKEKIRSYEKQYDDITQEILALGDDKHDVDFKRAEDIEELEQENQNWINAAKKVQGAVNDTSSLQEQQRTVENLEQLKKELLDKFVKGSDENDELQGRVKDLAGPMQHLQHFNNHVYHKEHSEVPTKQFTLKVLKLLSAAYLQEDGDPDVFKGFFTNPHTNDVIPFNYNNKMPEFERIEEVWDTLSQILDQGSGQ
ncbi:hypothetical protein FGB62_55g035 [Gracilaria domingensis]|nr:hypothetical protein FGB62_55g035 [Gracilaria domingensis]